MVRGKAVGIKGRAYREGKGEISQASDNARKAKTGTSQIKSGSSSKVSVKKSGKSSSSHNTVTFGGKLYGSKH